MLSSEGSPYQKKMGVEGFFEKNNKRISVQKKNGLHYCNRFPSHFFQRQKRGGWTFQMVMKSVKSARYLTQVSG